MKTIAIGIAVLLAALGLGYGLAWLGVIGGRPIQKYQTETAAQVYDTSRVYQQGTNNDLARYCREWRTATTAAAKSAVAELIRSTKSTYNGPLTDTNKACLNEIGE